MSTGLPGFEESIFFWLSRWCDGMVDILIISLNLHKTDLLEPSVSLIFLGEDKAKRYQLNYTVPEDKRLLIPKSHFPVILHHKTKF